MRNRAASLLWAGGVALLLFAIRVIHHVHRQVAYNRPVGWRQISLSWSPRKSEFVEQRSLQHASLDSANPRIVGGRPAGRHPYFSIPASSMLCGSTLIHSDILLSAAHCAGVFLAGAYVGSTNISGNGATFVEVEKEIIHPEFNRAKFLNDIMLVKLRDSVPHPIVELNSDRDVPRVGQLVTAVGLGDTIGRNYFSQELLEVGLPVQKHTRCMRHFFGGIEDDTMICAGGEKDMDACSGDSGGPLLTPSGAQVGIVSFGDGCGKAGVPAVYTRISAYRRWIDETVCKTSRHPPSSCKQSVATTISSEWEEVISGFLAASSTAAPQTKIPTNGPSQHPSSLPSNNPSESPSRPRSTESPSRQPTDIPTIYKSATPSNAPLASPSKLPSKDPTASPSDRPSSCPSQKPTQSPSLGQTNGTFAKLPPKTSSTSQTSERPSSFPSQRPTKSPSLLQANGSVAKLPPHTSSAAPQTKAPSSIPSQIDTEHPTSPPSTLKAPTPGPSSRPPTEGPTSSPPSNEPTTGPPSASPSSAKRTPPPTGTSRPSPSEPIAQLPDINPPATHENNTLLSGENCYHAGLVLPTGESRKVRCKEQAITNFPISIQQFMASALGGLASQSPPATTPLSNQNEVPYSGAANVVHQISSSSSQSSKKIKLQKMKSKKHKWQKRRGMNRVHGRNGNLRKGRRRMSSP